LKVFVHFYLIHASSFAAFVGLDIVDGGYKSIWLVSFAMEYFNSV